ncbi:alcohol acetyltransferase-domain-containing protein [Apiospora marii]|uniref:Alcohol acetyltransferase-domain-containing protein n=1 Tax=Apiospora marii TaxID=335849 RepID=A0ABR1RVK6_9PEZI
MHSLNVYYGCALTCRYAIPAAFRGEAEEDALREHFEKAVALAVLDHPLLQVGLADESTKDPVWVRLDRIDLGHHIQWQTVPTDVDVKSSRSSSATTTATGSMIDALLEDMIKAQHDLPYPDLETRPGWKMVVVRAPDLDYLEAFFGINHANADGESAKFFQQTLLEKLNLLAAATVSSSPALSNLDLQEHILTLPVMPASKFTPAHEALVDLPLSPVWAVSIALKQMLPSWLRSHPLKPLPWAPQRPVPIRTALRLVHVEAAALQRVLEACRCHDTTLTGLVQAMSVTSLAMRTPAATPPQNGNAKQKKKTKLAPLILGTPVSMHRYIRPEACPKPQDRERVMVNSVTYCFHHYHGRRLATLYDLAGRVVRDNAAAAAAQAHEEEKQQGPVAADIETNALRLEDALWEQAARVRRQLAQKLAKGTRNDLTGLLRFIPDFRVRMAEEMAAQGPRDVTLEVSNLGVIDGGSGAVEVQQPEKAPLQPSVKDCCGSSTSSAAAADAEKKGGAPQDSAVVVGITINEEEPSKTQSQESRATWTMERAMFTQSGIPHGVALVVSPIAVKGKGLTIAVNWQDGLVDQGVGAGLAADLESWLGSLGRGDHISFSGSHVKA